MIRTACMLLLASATAFAADVRTFTGKVVAVTDGDTLTVLEGTEQRKIRLHGIDAPEKAQPFGTKAREHLGEMVAGKSVRVIVTGTDRYKRLIGRVQVGEVDVNTKMVRDGLAWQYRQFDKSQALADAEEEARRDRRGLWADKEPVPPWEWRKRK